MHLSPSSVAFILAASTGTVSAFPANEDSKGSLPIVDLGYVRQQASAFNETGQYYNFTNIAFAQPPLGDLRFSAPHPPKHIRGIQNGGLVPKICPQAYPTWLSTELEGVSSVPKGPYETEDCLYLDVLVPDQIFQKRGGKGSPVMVWIYGGGFVIGSKTGSGDPAGLLEQSASATDSEGVIYVAMNYRLGNFGLLGGDLFRSQGGTGNIALLDQRLALEWVQRNIHRFGGDPSRVTVFGESGGAGSIAHQITASTHEGNALKPPFQRAIMQSPAEVVIVPSETANEQVKTFLQKLNVSTLAEARKLDTNVLQDANRKLIADFPTGQFPYSFTHDGAFVRETARKAMLEGRICKEDLSIMTAYNLNEGFIFTPENITNDGFNSYVKGWIPNASSVELSRISDELYPESAYSSAFERISNFIGDALFKCNAASYQKAFQNQGYAYEFSIPAGPAGAPVPPPGYHTQDIAFTYFNGEGPRKVFNSTVAVDMQKYLVNFAVHGTPNAAGSEARPAMPSYGANHQMLNLTTAGFHVVSDPLAIEISKKCEFFAKL